MASTAKQNGVAGKSGVFPQLLRSVPLDIRPPGGPEDCPELCMASLLRRLLCAADGETGKTWAQRLIEVWILEALDGNFRALQEILDRADKGRPPGDAAVDTRPPIDEQTAGKILEILCGSDEGQTSG